MGNACFSARFESAEFDNAKSSLREKKQAFNMCVIRVILHSEIPDDAECAWKKGCDIDCSSPIGKHGISFGTIVKTMIQDSFDVASNGKYCLVPRCCIASKTSIGKIISPSKKHFISKESRVFGSTTFYLTFDCLIREPKRAGEVTYESRKLHKAKRANTMNDDLELYPSMDRIHENEQ
jgi:hypothetical protein